MRKKKGSQTVFGILLLNGASNHMITELQEAKTKSKGFLIDHLKTRLAASPIEYHLMVQLPNPGNPTKDPSFVWPEDRDQLRLRL
jgi:catalase